MTDENNDLDHLATMIRSEMDQLKYLSERQKIAVRRLHWINNQLAGYPA